MEASEIRDIAIDSARAYYVFLDSNDKGIQEIEILKIERLPGDQVILKLRLSLKLFDTEALYFLNLRTNEKYDLVQIKVIEYDRDKNIILIKPSDQIADEVLKMKESDLKIISDLKFLVKRVETWYELNGSKVSLPKKPSKHSSHTSDIKYFKEKELQPSLEQKRSIENLLQSPFSYVWGAPGTGKTQFVLSYAILHYLFQGDRIAILAPTNNSIEQVLYGVLKMTDKAGIDRSRIIRLGTPSKKFADLYPEVCEEKGIQKRILECDKQISILNRMINHERRLIQLSLFNKCLQKIDELHPYIKILNLRDEELNNILDKFSQQEIINQEDERSLFDLRKEHRRNLVKSKSLGSRISRFISGKQSTSEEIVIILDEKIFFAQKELEKGIDKLKRVQKEKENAIRKKKGANTKIESLVENIKEQFAHKPGLSQDIAQLKPNNYLEVKKSIHTRLGELKRELEIDIHIHNEYKESSLSSLQQELDNYKDTRKKLSDSTTEERIKNVNVIACTLDGYIGRYSESKLPVQHIFLDEAGYANIIKALTLFNHSVPITLLGDHMQLPPVCEINGSSIRDIGEFRNVYLWSQSAIYLESLFKRDQHFCFRRYIENEIYEHEILSTTTLNSTFRFGENLAGILSKYVYESEFHSAITGEETKVQFVDAPKNEPTGSRLSISEVRAIEAIVDELKKTGNTDYAIIAPYRNQVQLLGNHLPEERKDLKILTVHRSQGREWHTVILSVVDTSDMWFVNTLSKESKGKNVVNTAISRAKSNLIIVCDRRFWIKQEHQLISELLKIGYEKKIEKG